MSNTMPDESTLRNHTKSIEAISIKLRSIKQSLTSDERVIIDEVMLPLGKLWRSLMRQRGFDVQEPQTAKEAVTFADSSTEA